MCIGLFILFQIIEIRAREKERDEDPESIPIFKVAAFRDSARFNKSIQM
jgi:hypothetical protein